MDLLRTDELHDDDDEEEKQLIDRDECDSCGFSTQIKYNCRQCHFKICPRCDKGRVCRACFVIKRQEKLYELKYVPTSATSVPRQRMQESIDELIERSESIQEKSNRLVNFSGDSPSIRRAEQKKGA
jgi:hypothetical protein